MDERCNIPSVLSAQEVKRRCADKVKKKSGFVKFKVLKLLLINTLDGPEAVIFENNSDYIARRLPPPTLGANTNSPRSGLGVSAIKECLKKICWLGKCEEAEYLNLSVALRRRFI